MMATLNSCPRLPLLSTHYDATPQVTSLFFIIVDLFVSLFTFVKLETFLFISASIPLCFCSSCFRVLSFYFSTPLTMINLEDSQNKSLHSYGDDEESLVQSSEAFVSRRQADDEVDDDDIIKIPAPAENLASSSAAVTRKGVSLVNFRGVVWCTHKTPGSLSDHNDFLESSLFLMLLSMVLFAASACPFP